ncbi:MAG: hypothetical protein IPM71_05340 [Bacteroidota bacterium]|nr:MAG: hypothetical protein IPM71_05340 [Bacteroidota bacterium]
MKSIQLFVILILLCESIFSQYDDTENRQLWLITAKISTTKTHQRDTSSTFDAGGHAWSKESHQSAQTSASGQITAVVENQAENPDLEFLYTSDAGEPLSFSVTGKGTYNSSSKHRETIDGKVVDEDIRSDNVSGSARPEASIHFQYSGEYKSASASIDIKAVGSYSGKMFDGEWKDYGGDYDDYNIWCSGGCDLGSDRNCNINKTANGYSASWKSSESKKRSTASGPEFTTEEHTLEITIVPYKESDKPAITLAGCKNIGVGETGTVTATAKPEGGSYKFWVEPGDILSVTSDGSATATVNGVMPGEGVLMVEYTTPDGKTAQTSMEASCVSIESYNGGEEIPQIALYDVDGNKKSGILTISVTGQPGNAAELVKFEPANPGILSAVGIGNKVTLQGIVEGSTMLQAKSECGAAVGPAVEVEVVKCDDETIATIERIKEAALENLEEATEELQSYAGSPEFEKARDELVSSTIELLAKAGLTIIANGKTSGAVKVTAEIADKGSALSEIIASSNPEELKNNIGKTASGESFEKIVKNQFGEVVEGLWGKSLSAAIGVLEVQQAAEKFGNNIGEILKHEEVMKSVVENYEKAHRDLKRITYREQQCNSQTEESEDEDIELADLTPIPGEQTPSTNPTPTIEQPTEQEPQNDQPTDETPATDDEVLVDPEPPTIPPKQVGLPYEPEECGCNSSQNLTVKSTDFAKLGGGIKNLGECVEDFRSTSLTDYQNALQELSSLSGSLSELLKTDAEAFLVKAIESKPQLDELVIKVKAYETAGEDFLNTLVKCPESVTTGMEIFQSAETITIESIDTNY